MEHPGYLWLVPSVSCPLLIAVGTLKASSDCSFSKLDPQRQHIASKRRPQLFLEEQNFLKSPHIFWWPEVICSGHNIPSVNPVQRYIHPDLSCHCKWKQRLKYRILVTNFRMKIHIDLDCSTTRIRQQKFGFERFVASYCMHLRIPTGNETKH
jgi:hypothetical protein